MSTERDKFAPTIIDLFSGCGGFSLGAELAGFRSLAAVEIDPILQSGYRRNFTRSNAIQASVADIDLTDWRHLIGAGRPDGIIGGPPCQGFSRIGRRRKDDPRNSMLFHFYRHVRELRPKFFIMENVQGLLDRGNIGALEAAMEEIPGHYKVLAPMVVNAADFGAATIRHRVVIIGYDPADVDMIDSDFMQPSPNRRIVTVREAISDLPSPVAQTKDETDFGWARYPPRGRGRLPQYAQLMRMAPPEGLGSREAVERHVQGYISGVAETKHSRAIARRYAVVAGGKSDKKTKSYRLEWDGQCPTLRAGTGPDKGAFQAVRPLHPGIGRVITVREAARLQGFPDWFVFHKTKWHSFRMLGNSISPFVSGTLLAKLASKTRLSLAANAIISQPHLRRTAVGTLDGTREQTV